MRTFEDENGAVWVASVRERPGEDYKGRYHLTMRPEDGSGWVELVDVRWNSERTALRTLRTMSGVELRRRLRSARGRARPAAVSPEPAAPEAEAAVREG